MRQQSYITENLLLFSLYKNCCEQLVWIQALCAAGMGVFSFARYDDDFYKKSYAGRLKKAINLKPGDYIVFQGYYTPPISSTLLLRSCKVWQPDT